MLWFVFILYKYFGASWLCQWGMRQNSFKMGARGESAHSPSEIVGVGEVFLQLQHLYWNTLPCTLHPYSVGRGGLPKNWHHCWLQRTATDVLVADKSQPAVILCGKEKILELLRSPFMEVCRCNIAFACLTTIQFALISRVYNGCLDAHICCADIQI